MVIPVSSLFCWMTEGLWGLFLLFLPSLCYSKLPWNLSTPTPFSEQRGLQRLMTPLRSSRREALRVAAWDNMVRWWWKLSSRFTELNLIGWVNLSSFKILQKNVESTKRSVIWSNLYTLYAAVSCQSDLTIISPYTGIKIWINKSLQINWTLWQMCCSEWRQRKVRQV